MSSSSSSSNGAGPSVSPVGLESFSSTPQRRNSEFLGRPFYPISSDPVDLGRRRSYNSTPDDSGVASLSTNTKKNKGKRPLSKSASSGSFTVPHLEGSFSPLCHSSMPSSKTSSLGSLEELDSHVITAETASKVNAIAHANIVFAPQARCTGKKLDILARNFGQQDNEVAAMTLAGFRSYEYAAEADISEKAAVFRRRKAKVDKLTEKIKNAALLDIRKLKWKFSRKYQNFRSNRLRETVNPEGVVAHKQHLKNIMTAAASQIASVIVETKLDKRLQTLKTSLPGEARIPCFLLKQRDLTFTSLDMMLKLEDLFKEEMFKRQNERGLADELAKYLQTESGKALFNQLTKFSYNLNGSQSDLLNVCKEFIFNAKCKKVKVSGATFLLEMKNTDFYTHFVTYFNTKGVSLDTLKSYDEFRLKEALNLYLTQNDPTQLFPILNSSFLVNFKTDFELIGELRSKNINNLIELFLQEVRSRPMQIKGCTYTAENLSEDFNALYKELVAGRELRHGDELFIQGGKTLYRFWLGFNKMNRLQVLINIPGNELKNDKVLPLNEDSDEFTKNGGMKHTYV